MQTFVTDRGLPAALQKVAQESGIAVVEALDKAAHIARPLPEGFWSLNLLSFWVAH